MTALDDPIAGTPAGPPDVQPRSRDGFNGRAPEAGARDRSRSGRSAADDDRRVIVVGSGPAGAIAALTLVKQGIPVTMLESGRDVPSGWLVRAGGRNILRRRPRVEDLNDHGASGDRDAAWYRALVPGGMSHHWAGAIPRFVPEDFYEGERLHERYRWPISYRELEPYYARVERLLGLTASRRNGIHNSASVATDAWRLPAAWRRVAGFAEACGHHLTPLPVAYGPRWAFRRSGVGFDTFTQIVRPLQRSPRFRLHLGAHALRLEWHGDKRKVRAVVYRDRATGSTHRVTGAAVVVAGGPLASTKLLLDSACPDFPDGLGDTDGLLGRYLHDHPHDIGRVELDRALPCLGRSAYLTRAPHEESAPLLGGSCVLASTSLLDKARAVRCLTSKTFGLWIFGTMVPTHDNYVRLDPQRKDEFGLPMLDIHVRYGGDVERNVAAIRARLAEILDAAGYRSTVSSFLPRLVPGASIHYGGTVRMHNSPKHGMLDGWNRLHAVDNVVVADASSFTTGPEKNPTLTVMAIAARASHRLAEDLRSA